MPPHQIRIVFFDSTANWRQFHIEACRSAVASIRRAKDSDTLDAWLVKLLEADEIEDLGIPVRK
jgi:hypothetical protein